MASRARLLLILTALAGVLLVYALYQPVLWADRGASGEQPPPLSDQPFHQSYVNDEICLTCHAQKKELPAFDLVAPKMDHDLRKNCGECHQLPAG